MASTIQRWFFYGLTFGLCFPLGALSIDIIVSNLSFSWLGVKQAHFDNFLHWIIDSAPIVLGFMGYLIGKNRKKLETHTQNLELLVDKRTLQLQQNQLRLEEYNQNLEEEVKKRTGELLQSEKMAALGQLIASIAHEINTPLGAINSSSSNIHHFLEQSLTVMPSLFQSFSKKEMDEFMFVLNKSMSKDVVILSAKEQNQKCQALMLQLEEHVEDAEDTADTLVDMGVYEDIEKIIPLLKRDDEEEVLELAYKLSEIWRATKTINQATDQASKIVFALKSYVHKNEHEEGEKENCFITESLENILMLYYGKMKHNIELVKNYDKNLPILKCYPDELAQVWTNLIHNALQAMDYKGTLTISIKQQNDTLEVSIGDTGKGIAPENISKIFNAFYTTKPAGEGSGLGLHIIGKILDKHSGSIKVDSEAGCTVFTVTLPIQ